MLQKKHGICGFKKVLSIVDLTCRDHNINSCTFGFMFGIMLVPDIAYGSVVDNWKIQSIFGCSGMGGMRRSHSTNTLVLICKHVNNIYCDRWHGDILYYTGMGAVGNQTLEGNQNKTLYQTYSRPTSSSPDVYLFEVYREGEYTYRGPVEVAFKPFQEQQMDEYGQCRIVWVFPLKLKGTNPTLPTDFTNLRQGGTIKPRDDIMAITPSVPKRLTSKCCYANSISGFFDDSEEEWISTMSDGYKVLMNESASTGQIQSWKECYGTLQIDLSNIEKERPEFSIVFEYRLPYGFGRRPDVMLVSNEQEIILEHPRGASESKNAMSSVGEYIHYLNEYHPMSKGKSIRGIVFDKDNLVLPFVSSSVLLCKPGEGYDLISKLLKGKTTSCNIENWLNSKA